MESEAYRDGLQRFHPESFHAPTAVLLSLTLGLVAGLELHSILKPSLVVTEGDVAEYLPDQTQITAHYDKVKKSGGDYFKQLEPYEIVNAAYSLLSQKENVYSVAVGSSVAMGLVSQRIESTQMKQGDRYFEESNSTSKFVSLYNRMYQEGDNTTKYWGSTPDYASDKPVKVSNATYADEMGRNVSDALTYIVSPKTESNQDLSGKGLTKITKNEDGTYNVDMEVDPKSSTLKYVKQMKTISNLKAPPEFTYVHLTWNLDASLGLRWFQNVEKYHATLSSGIGSDCEGSMTTVFLEELPPGGIPEPGGSLPSYPETEEKLLQQYVK